MTWTKGYPAYRINPQMTLNAEITTKDEDISTKKLTVVGYVGRKSKNKIEHRTLQTIISTEK